jgi:hypothetical protein
LKHSLGAERAKVTSRAQRNSSEPPLQQKSVNKVDMGIEPFKPKQNFDKTKPRGKPSPEKLEIKTRSLYNDDLPAEFNNQTVISSRMTHGDANNNSPSLFKKSPAERRNQF